MKIAYADPPYLGYSRYYKADPNCAEVDHAALIAQLERDFDGWARSLYSNSLHDVLPLCPRNARIGAWVKTWFAGRRGVSPRYGWEPVIFKPARKKQPRWQTPIDWVASPTTTKTGLIGAKPEQFCIWLFDILHAHPKDEFTDLYPGTGAVSRYWKQWQQQMALWKPRDKPSHTQGKLEVA